MAYHLPWIDIRGLAVPAIALVMFILFAAGLVSASETCEGYCGTYSPAGCWCDDLCEGFGDCCADYNQYCVSPVPPPLPSTPEPGPSSGSCSNGKCEAYETCNGCPADCGQCGKMPAPLLPDYCVSYGVLGDQYCDDKQEDCSSGYVEGISAPECDECATGKWKDCKTQVTQPAPAPAPNPSLPSCGNGIREGSEECDGPDFGGQSCTNKGFAGGVLKCSSFCTFDTSGCTGIDAGPQDSFQEDFPATFPADFPEEKQPEFDGYIVEYKKEPVLEYLQNMQYQTSGGKQTDVKYASATLAAQIQNQRNLIGQEHDKAADDIASRLYISETELSGKITGEFSNVFNGIAIEADESEMEKIKQSPYVKGVHMNYMVKAHLMDSVPLIGADKVWKMDKDGGQCGQSGKECLTGKGVKIGILDTGVDYTHPDLGGCLGPACKVIGGYDFISDDNDPMDDHGHGTHVASIAAGNGTLKGVTPDAKIVAYKVLDKSGEGTDSEVIAAVEKAVDPNNDGDFSDRLDIISLSLGGPGSPDDPLSKSIDNAVDAGVVAVIAAGNRGGIPERAITSPGTARKAITVGATDKENKIAFFSSRGPFVWKNDKGIMQFLIKPDVLAPGVLICAAKAVFLTHPSSCLDGKHFMASGTSMAAPHVSGVVALIRQAHPDWNPEQIKMALKVTAADIGLDMNDQGYGRIDALKAVSLKEAPPVARLDNLGVISGNIAITGSAYGENFNKYSLYYGYYGYGKKDAHAHKWEMIKIHESKTQVKNGVLLDSFDSTVLEENGYYTLRLAAENENGVVGEDNALLRADNIKIDYPLDNDVLRAGEKIEIKGSIGKTPKFKNYAVYYSIGKNSVQWQDYGITLAGKEGVLAEWDTSPIKEAGFYSIRIISNYGDAQSSHSVTDYIYNIYLDPTLKKGWPVRVYEDYGEITPYNITNYLTPPVDYYTSVSGTSPESSDIGTLIKEDLAKKLQAPGESGYYISNGFLETVVADIDKDNKKEIIVYRGGIPPKVVAYNPDGSMRFSINVGSGTFDDAYWGLPMPLITDMDNDGFGEIIVAAYKPIECEEMACEPKPSDYQSKIYAFRHDGSLMAGWPVSIPMDYRPGLASADLDLDGKNEIIVQANDIPDEFWSLVERKMTIISGSGKIISQWTLPKIQWSSLIMPLPAVGNFDDDPFLEIVSAGPSEKAVWNEKGDFVNEGVVYVYNMDGSVVKGWPIYTKGVIAGSPAVGDVNKDGKEEIVVGLMESTGGTDKERGGVYAFDRNGKILPGWPAIKGSSFLSSPSLADFNYDGYLEIAANTDSFPFSTYLISHDGSVMNGWPRNTEWRNQYSSAIGDITGDAVPDVVAMGGWIPTSDKYYNYNDGGVYAWDASGNLIKGFPKITEYSYFVVPPATIADIDNDGKVDIVASSSSDFNSADEKFKRRGSIYVWETGAPYNQQSMHWPMFQQNPQHTGNLKIVQPVTGQCPDSGKQTVFFEGAGAKKTVKSYDGKTFLITLNGWNTAGTTAYLSVNGISYNWTEGNVYTVDGVQFKVEDVDILWTGSQEGIGRVKLVGCIKEIIPPSVCTLSISPAKATFAVDEPWTLNLNDCPANTQVQMCTKPPSPSGSSCTPMGATDVSGQWSKPGTFSNSDAGTWVEYAKVGSATSNDITFTVVGQPAVTLTANGGKEITVKPDDLIIYSWSSANANVATSWYNVDGPDCGGPAGTRTWIANTLTGSTSTQIQQCQAGRTYWITYKVSNAAGETAEDTVIVRVGQKSQMSIAGIQGYDQGTGQYSSNGQAGKYLILYGTFEDSGNIVYVQNVAHAPSYQSKNQINIKLDPAITGGYTALVRVSNSGSESNAYSIYISEQQTASGCQEWCSTYAVDYNYGWPAVCGWGDYCSGCPSCAASTPSCAQDCSYAGQKQCEGNYAQSCGNFDEDSCLEWGNAEFCPYGCSETTGTCQSAPELSASLTANNAYDINVNPGDIIAYSWSSQNAVAATSWYNVDGDDCWGQGVRYGLPWVANNLGDSTSTQVQPCQAGRTYWITYKVADAFGKTAESTIKIFVNPGSWSGYENTPQQYASQQYKTSNSCSGYCGTYSPAGCWCDAYCVTAGDCCPDYYSLCGY